MKIPLFIVVLVHITIRMSIKRSYEIDKNTDEILTECKWRPIKEEKHPKVGSGFCSNYCPFFKYQDSEEKYVMCDAWG